MTIRKFIDWLTLEDYAQAKRQAVRRIIEKQARGSIAAQQGAVMEVDELRALSRRADDSVRRLERVSAGA